MCQRFRELSFFLTSRTMGYHNPPRNGKILITGYSRNRRVWRAAVSPTGETRPMHVLVTGGAGYVGSATAAYFLAAGHRVTVFDSLIKGHREAIPEGADFVQGDLGDLGALDVLFQTHDLRRGRAFCGVHRGRRVDAAACQVFSEQRHQHQQPAGSNGEARRQAPDLLVLGGRVCQQKRSDLRSPIPSVRPTSTAKPS